MTDMKWIKKGRIIEPPGRDGWMASHAGLPIAERVNDDVYRIYFHTRDRQNRSRPAYVVTDINRPHEILEMAERPLFDCGPLGSFDESGVMPCWIVNHGDTKYVYYVGWNQAITVRFRIAIGLAISDDGGRTFEKYSSGPLMDRSVHDPCFVGGPCVLVDNGLWRMWYISCVRWVLEANGPEHSFHIKYAQSEDGIHWERDGTVCIDFQSEDEYAIGRPCVLKEDGIYKMWYCYRGQSYQIGYAESADGLQWERKDEEAGIDASESGWDSEMIGYQFVFDHKGERYMLYNGNGYGKTGIGLAVLER